MKRYTQKITQFTQAFLLPILILVAILFYLISGLLGIQEIGIFLLLIAIVTGSFDLFKETYLSLRKGHYALDYIAILAILVAVGTGEYLVAGILALMIASGRTLEAYGVSQAKKSLSSLIERIPNDIIIWEKGKVGEKKKISAIHVGENIYIRKGEVIPLDGTLESESALLDESSLTGEPYFIEKMKGDIIRSGTVNVGEAYVLRVTKVQKDSTYAKIVAMVRDAQDEKSPLVRLADRYSTFFTIITLTIATVAFFISGFDLSRVLAVLAIATPCPLIIATPIALLGGVNAAAKKRIIIKKLASLEGLSKVTAVVFDKTGTITFGKPRLTSVDTITDRYKEKDILGIAGAIERSSLHPLAKAVVLYAKEKNAPVFYASHITETIGRGITGKVNGKTFTLSKIDEKAGMAIGLYLENKLLAVFSFEDELRNDSKDIMKQLVKMNMKLFMFTGDKKEAAGKVGKLLGENITIKSELTPQDKQEGIKLLKKEGNITAMIGDGINDAPALALADVGLVFSNEEQTAATDSADIVFLGGDFAQVEESFALAQRTMRIALQSIRWGIGISIVGMLMAASGSITPLAGAAIQEAIDVAVIINALRASRR